MLKWLASSFGAGDDFSSPANSVSCPLTENTILLGQTFQLLKKNWIYRHKNSCLSHAKTERNLKEDASHFIIIYNPAILEFFIKSTFKYNTLTDLLPC